VASARQRDALLLAAGQLARMLAMAVGQTDQRQQRMHALVDRVALHLAVHEPVRDVVVHGEVREQRIRLEHDPVVAQLRRQPRDVAAVLHDVAGVLRLEPRDDP
jgi:hypothetical protein